MSHLPRKSIFAHAFAGIAVGITLASVSLQAAQANGTALVRHAPTIDGTVEGSVQQMLGENATLNGSARITGDLFVCGTPNVVLNGSVTYGGILNGTGNAAPSNYQIMLNGGVTLGHVVRRTNAVTLPTVVAPPAPAGTRNVTISAAGQSAGAWSTLRHLILNANVGNYTVPAGTYGDFTINAGSSITLGVAGAAQPSTYNFQNLTLNGTSQFRVVGPIIVTVKNGFTANGTVGASSHPSWLTLRIATGGFTLNSAVSVYGQVEAPNGTVIINAGTLLVGGVACDRLTVNASGTLRLFTPQAANQPPVANAQSVSTNEDTAKSITLTGADPEAATLTYTIVSLPANGSLTPATGGSANRTYTPAPNWSGTDSFTFKVSDGALDSAIATVTITVQPVNDAPEADPKSITTDEDAGVSIVLSGLDVEGSALAFAVTSPPAHGTLSAVIGASVTYTPSRDYHGPDEFSYVVNDGALTSFPALVAITVVPINDAPIAIPREVTTEEETDVAVALTGTDVDGDALSFEIVVQPGHGQLLGIAPALVYRPAPNFAQTDTFVFRVHDGQVWSAPATVTIHVDNINDVPTAQNRTLTLDEDVATDFTVSGADPDDGPLTFALLTAPEHGALTAGGLPITTYPHAGLTSGALRYTPAANFHGPDSFTFRTRDGFADSAPATVSITVRPINDAPTANPQEVTTAEDTPAELTLTGADVDDDALTFTVTAQPLHGTLVPLVSGGPVFTYTPAANFHGQDSFTFRVSDGQLASAEVTVPITVTSVNDAPIATPDSGTTPEDTALALTLSGSDVDNLPADFVFTIVTQPTSGTIAPAGGPHFTYVPNEDFHGSDSFTFTVGDGDLTSAAVTFALEVTPVNDAPQVTNLSLVTDRGVALPFTLNALDIDGDALTYAIAQPPAHGTLTHAGATGGPNYTYTPAAGFADADDTFTFTVSDGIAPSVAGTVVIHVRETNHAPSAQGAALTVTEDVPKDFVLSAQDSDGDALSYLIVTQPQHGGLSGIAPNQTYTPDENYSGPDSFTFKVWDGLEYSNVATITIVVEPANDAPVAQPQTLTTPEDTPVTITLAGTDGDPGDAANFVYSILSPPAHGSLGAVQGNTVVYFPGLNATAPVSFQFAVNDGFLTSSPATILVTITPVNDAPVANAQVRSAVAGLNLPITLTGFDLENQPLGFEVLSQPSLGVLSGTAPQLVYTAPATSSGGADSFSFRVFDGERYSAPATVSINVSNGVNQVPLVDAGPDKIAVLPAFTQTTTTTFAFTPLSVGFNGIIGIDYHPPTNKVIVSVNYPSGYPSNFELISRDGSRGAFSAISGLTDELKLATVRDEGGAVTIGGFRPGEMFTGSGVPGVVIRVSADGSVVQNPWVSLPGEPGLMRGGLYVDRTGVFGGDLIVVTTAGNVWRINSSGMPTKLASVGNHLEGLSTIPNDPVKYGPWAGKILAGAEGQGLFYAVAPDGAVTTYSLGIAPEDIDIIPPFENLFCVSYAEGRLLGVPEAAFRGMVGDILVAQEFPGNLYRVRWNGSAFEKFQLGPSVPQFEHVTFAPAGIVEVGQVVSPAVVTLDGSVTDDGLPIGGTLSAQWAQASGPAGSLIATPTSAATSVSIFSPGEYVFGLAGSDGTLSATDEMNILAVINQVPSVDAGPDRVMRDAGGIITLLGAASDDGYPVTPGLSVLWTAVEGSLAPVFSDPTALQPQVTFPTAGIYQLKLTATDGLNEAADYVEVRAGLVYPFALPDRIAAWWPGSGHPREVINGNHDVEFFNGADYGVGKVSQGFNFDGSNDYGRVAAHGQLDIGASAAGLTLELWARPTRQADNQVLLNWGSGTTRGVELWQHYNGNGLWVYLWDTAGANHVLRIDGSFFTMNTWQHLAVTYDKVSGVGRVYRNGVLVLEQNVGVFTPQTSLPLTFAAYAQGGYNYQGGLDEVSFYNRPLSITEIRAIYESGANGKPPAIPNAAPLVNAGPDRAVPNVSVSLNLVGTVTDDGQPDGAEVRSAWRMISGPDAAEFSQLAGQMTTVTFPLQGTYVLEFSAEDGMLSAYDLMEVRVGTGTVEPPANIAAWWPANGHPHEVINGNHDVELYNGAGYGISQVSQGFTFDGSDDHGRVAAHSELNVGASTAGLTLELWARPTRQADNQVLFNWGSSTTRGVELWQYYNGNGLWVYLWDTVGTNHLLRIDGGFFTMNAWQHVAVTYDKVSGLSRVYRNGVLVLEQNVGVFTPQTNLPLTFAAYAQGGYNYQGGLDEVSFYNRPLTITEINAIYQAGASGKTPPDDNEPPVVSAGPDVAVPNTTAIATLAGVVTDDNKPYGAPAILWSLVDGPTGGTVDFADATAATTTAMFSVPGTYLLKLTATEGYVAPVSDLVEVRVGTATVEPSANIAAWWPANGHPHEVINGNHDVELYNGAGYGAAHISQGVTFDGSDDHGRVAAHSELNVGASAAGLTLELWARPTRQVDNQVLLNWGSSTTRGVELWQYYNGNGLWIYLWDTGGTNHLLRIDGGFFTMNAWQHVAVTYDKVSGLSRVYRNGVLVLEQNVGVFTPQTSLPLTFAAYAQGGYNYQGGLDEVSFYNRPLSITEINAIYQAGANGKTPPDDNEPPVVDAGADVAVPNTTAIATLAGVVLDDNKPFGAPAILWTIVDRPAGGEVAFADDTAATTTAMFNVPGTYLLKLTATEGYVAPVSDLMEVRVGTATVEPSASIAAWWPGNGHPREVINGNHDVELYNGAGYGAAHISQGFTFDGSDDHGRVAAHSELNVGASAAGLTLELWARPTRQADSQVLINWGSSTTRGVELWQYYNGNGLWVYLWDTVGTNHLLRIDGGLFTMNAWQHVAVTYDKTSGLARIYRNGVLVLEQNVGVFTPQTSLPLTFAAYAQGGYNYQGGLDEVSFYNRPLSITEINAIYQAGTSGKTPPDDNEPPVVSAGPDVMLPNTASAATLAGTVLDDNKPFGAPAILWTIVDRPAGGEVAFADDTAAATTATFSVPGTYLLKLTATEGYVAPVSDLMEVRVGTATVPSAANIAAWWPANGHPREVINGNHDVEFYNGAGYGPGQVSQAFTFDGSNDHGRVAAHSELDIGVSTAGLTVELWAKPARSLDSQNLLTWGTSSTDGVRLMQYYNGNGLWVYLPDTDGGNHLLRVDGGFFTINAWHHLAVTYDRATGLARIYRNGSLIYEQNHGAFTPLTSLPLTFGASLREGNYYQGALDEVSFYNRPLSITEINAIYQAGASGKTPIVSNSAPVVSAGANASTVRNLPLLLSGFALDDGLPNPPAALTYQWSKVSGPGEVTFATPTALSTTATMGAAGAYVLRLSASDSALSSFDDVAITVTSPPPAVSLIEPADGATLAANFRTYLIARATASDGTIAKVEFFRDGTKVGETTAATVGRPDDYFVELPAGFAIGNYTLTARATDNAGGSTLSAPALITVIADPGTSPLVEIVTPFDAAQVTEPTAVTGVVHSLVLSSWSLEYRRKSTPGLTPAAWKALATGTTNVGTPGVAPTPSTGGPLGTFDPTRLLNGVYEIRLVAFDSANRNSVFETTVVVDGRLKFGQLTESFVDLSIPSPGFPLEVVRRYDSRDDRIGDFGRGGSLATTDFRVEKNLRLGEQWFAWSDNSGPAGFPMFYLEPSPPEIATGVPPSPRVVTITLPSDVVFRFSARMVPNRQALAAIESGRLVFDAMPGTVGTLEPLDDSLTVYDDVLVAGGAGEVDLFDVVTADVFDPSIFRLTLVDGTQYIIDEVLGVLRQTDPSGNSISYQADRIVHSNGLQLTLIRDALGRITEIRDPAGNSVDYVYDAESHLISVADRSGRTTAFNYAAGTSLMTSITPPAAVYPTFNAWDGLDRLSARVDALGNQTTMSYDLATYAQSKADPLGNVTTYHFDGYGRQTRMVNALGGETRYAYADPQHPLLQTSVTDPLGRITRYTFNAQGLPTIVRDPLGHATSYIYNALGLATRETDALGRAIIRTYDSSGNLLTETARNGGVMTNTYNAAGGLLSTTDPLGGTTTFTYNLQGLPTVEEVRAADGSLVETRSLAYNIYGNLTAETITQTAADGSTIAVTTSHTYDLAGRPLVTTAPDGGTTTNTYDAAGRLASTVDRFGLAISYTHDAAGRRTLAMFPDGSSETTTYDAKGRITSTTDRQGFTTATTYDALDRVTRVAQPDGGVTITTFDAAGQITSEIDPDGRTTTITYDAGGRPTGVVHPDGTSSAVNYDAVGDITTVAPRFFAEPVVGVTAPMAAKTLGLAPAFAAPDRSVPRATPKGVTAMAPPRLFTMAYDAMHRVTAIEHPDGTTASIAYDMLGRPTGTTNEKGQAWSYSYKDSRAVARSLVTGPLGYTEGYDVDALAQLTRRTDALNRSTLSDYDKYDLKKVTFPDGSTETYEFTDRRLSKITDRRGSVTSITYAGTPGTDGNARTLTRTLTVVDENSVETSGVTITTTETYDARSNVKSVVEHDLSGIRTTTHEYDFANRRTKTTHPDGSTLSTKYGPGGRVTEVVETDGGLSRTTTYAYDANGHPSLITFPDGTTNAFVHAADGRVLELTNARGGKTTYAYDDVDHRVTITDSIGAVTVHRFDVFGNLLSETDAAGRTTSYTYDALGRRIAETNALGQTTTTTYDLAGNVVTVTDALGRVASFAGYDANNRPVSVTFSGNGGSATHSYLYDQLGNLTGTVDPIGRTSTFEYDELSRQIRAFLPAGLVQATRFDQAGNALVIHAQPGSDATRIRTTRQVFDAANRLISRTHPAVPTNFSGFLDSATETLAYAGFGRVSSHVDVRGHATGYTYQGVTDRIASEILPGGATRSFGYDAMGNIVTATDARGVVTTQVFDAAQRVTQQIVAGARTTTFAHDLVGNLTRITHPTGQQVTSTYDALNRLATESVQVGASDTYDRAFAYDLAGRLAAVTDDHGTTTYGYDFQDHEASVEDALGNITSRTYDKVGNLLAVTDARGHTSTFSYDAAGQLIRSVDAENQIQDYVHDAFGEQTEHTVHGDGIQMYVTRFVYDDLGRVISTTRQDDGAGSLTTRQAFDASGLLTASADESGELTTYTYDDRGRLASVREPAGSTRSFAYDGEDNLIRATDALGHHRSSTYNAFGEVVTLVDAAGGVTSYTRDDGGRVTSVSDPTDRVTTFSYDVGGRMTGIILPDGTSTTTRAYDKFSNVLESVDPDGRRTTNAYDALNRVTRSAVMRGNIGPDVIAQAQYHYDPNGNLTGILDTLGRLTSFGFDRVNRRTSTTLPGATSPHELLAYDPRDLVTRRTDAAGHETANTYDFYGRLTQIQPPSSFAQAPIAFTYNARGLRTSMSDGLGTTTYAYDSRRRLTDKTTPYAGRISYGYDAADNLTSIATSHGDGLTQTYQYDAENRLDSVHITGGFSGSNLRTKYTRDAAGRITEIAQPNSVTETRTYDANGHPDSVSTGGATSSAGVFSATRSGSGRVASALQTGFELGDRAVDFDYDTGGRLTVESASGAGPTGLHNYTLDAEGNRLSRTGSLGGLASQNFSYDALGHLTDGSYSANGNLESAHPSTPAGNFGYDFRDQLASRNPALTPATSAVEFILDGDGRRVGKRVFNNLTSRWETTYFLVSELNPTGDEQVVAEVSNGSLTRSFALGEQRLAQHLFAETSITGGAHSLALDASGHVWAWGDNSEGQLGLGSTGGIASAPVAIPGLSNIAFVAAGRSHSLALGADGTVWAWGAGSRGQLGGGSSAASDVPTPIGALSDIVAIATHLDHNLALALDGTVWAWGANDRGQLGDGTTADRFAPVHLSGLVVTEIAVGQVHSLAVASDGVAFTWGDNTYGQLGAGSVGGFSPFPAMVAALGNVQRITAGGFHNLVGTTAGTVFAWGGNAYGQLGDGSRTDAAAPVEITLAASAVQLAAGSRHSLARMGDGSVRAWGDNRFGQLGTSGLGAATAPTVVPGIVGATDISAGGRRSLAQTAAGALVEWGGGDSTPRTIAGGLGSPVLGGEAGTNRLGYNLGFQQAWYGYDTQGNVRFLTNPAGGLTDRYTYDAFGNLIERAGSTDNDYLYQGERFDAETGLYHLRAREYDPRLGRFQQQDDFDGFVGQPFSHNRYAYAEADPVNLHDPSGRYATSIAGAMMLLYQMDDYLATLASIGPHERTLGIDDYLVDPMKAAMGIRPQIVNRERSLSLQATAQGALLGSLEQEAGAQAFPGGKQGKGADGDTFFTFKSGALFRQSPVERLVESAWSATRNLWPQLNTGAKYTTDPRYGKNLRAENRWSDVIYHDAILQAALRSSVAPGMEVQARFTRTLTGRNYVSTPGSISSSALIQLKLADGGLTQWTTPHPAGGADLFALKQVGRTTEWGQNELIEDFTSVNWADAWAQAAAQMNYSAASAVAYYRTGGNGALSLAAAFGMGLPVIGDFGQSSFTAATGRDFMTDETVGGLQRGLAIADVGLTLFGGAIGKAGGNLVEAAAGTARATRRATAAATRFTARYANRALKATERGLQASIQGARGAGQWLGNAAQKSSRYSRDFAKGFGQAYGRARRAQFARAYSDPFLGLGAELGNIAEGVAGGVQKARRAAENRGLTSALESSSKSSRARAFEDAAPGAASDMATKRRVVPALRFDNPNPRGRNVVRLDGVEGTRLIDRKLNVTTKSKQIRDLQRLAEALRQNPGFQGVIQVPDAAARRAAIRALDKAGVTNITVEVVP